MVLGPRLRLWLPYINLSIASTALLFQMTVLYPWHKELDESFHKLKGEQKAMLHEWVAEKGRNLDERVSSLEEKTASSPSVPSSSSSSSTPRDRIMSKSSR
eukprot:TRINITY_DN7253_c0_g3_i1.p1 TRINITY_DN7253_c0_g3~~TRINITY_DN7253_c0_g3_i1.p1  ORF type:complete len:101 (-),score=25.11 TRINITY_DN7253_c0_g3_i1:20-322(-)